MSEEKSLYYAEKQGRGSPVLFLPAAGFLGNEGQNIAYATFKEVDLKERRYTEKYIKRWDDEDHLFFRPVRGGHYVHWTDEGLLTDIHDFLKENLKGGAPCTQ